MPRLLSIILLGAMCACGGSSANEVEQPIERPPTPPAEPDNGVRLVVEPPDAVIRVNGDLVGKFDELPSHRIVALPAGLHQLEVSRDGFQTWRAELAVDEGVQQLVIRLRPVAP